ncbi:MAG: histidine kinase [Lachnospiraceae bacterium]|nr:histidine kinase [Lachnospiraceae bacterium]
MGKKKNLSLGRLTLRVMIPALVLLTGIILVMFRSIFDARSLVYKYIEDTAGLYVEKINTDIVQINYEVISLLKQNEKEWREMTDIRPDHGRNFEKVSAVQEQLRNLKIRYKEASCFYLYLDGEDVTILDSGTLFPTSILEGRNLALTESLREGRGEDTPYSQWSFIHDGMEDYVYSRYSKNGITMGCVIRMETLFSMLHVNSLGYEGIPYILDEEGRLIISGEDKDKVTFDEAGEMVLPRTEHFSKRKVYSFPITGLIGGSRRFYILVAPNGGILERIMSLQAALAILTAGIILGSALLVRAYYNRLLLPMKQFVGSLKNTEEEQWINENGDNNILELEMASKEFKGLLRKIKALKIDIYEKELEKQKTELETMQMQIRPHFYLNCLNLIHGMADMGQRQEIIGLTKMLSDYMRYVMRDAHAMTTLEDEVGFVRNYVQIQQIRYGKEAFSFEVIMDQGMEEYKVPAMLIHNFVENAVVHTVSLDSYVEITLYVVLERYEDGKYLYLCISDTGGGFPEKILEAARSEKPVYYDGRKHIGISNSVKRLRLLYGERAKISFSNMDEGYGAVVEVRIPAQKE